MARADQPAAPTKGQPDPASATSDQAVSGLEGLLPAAGSTLTLGAAVPLPAGAVLILTGLGGLGLMRRRKHAL